MKKLYLLMSLVLLLEACSHKGHLGTTAVVFAQDRTDSMLLPDANSVLDLYNYNTQVLCYGSYFKKTSMSDLSNNNPEVEFSIPNQDEGEKENLLDDPDFRKKEVLAFRDSVYDAIQQTFTMNSGEKPESKIYEAFCKELHALADMDADRKFFIVSSDLSENSELLSSYNESFARIISQDRKKALQVVREKFEDAYELPENLNGIVIYILHTTANKETDIRFNFFKDLYRQMCESRGATFHVKATSIIKNYTHE